MSDVCVRVSRSLKRSGETRNIISIEHTKDPLAQWLSYRSDSSNTLTKEYVIEMELSGLSVLGYMESIKWEKVFNPNREHFRVPRDTLEVGHLGDRATPRSPNLGDRL